MTLQQLAAQIAEESFREVTTEPEAYGIERPWKSVQEWIDYELDGSGPEQLQHEFDVDFKTAAEALTTEMRAIATLEKLNANLKS